jgi:anti-sigma factor ChrR (cupin superfamily)
LNASVETLDAGIVLPRHRHAAGYATVVLAGSFEEASFAGRFVAVPGDVLLSTGRWNGSSAATAARCVTGSSIGCGSGSVVSGPK